MGAKGRRRQGRAPATTSTTLAAEKRADKFMTGSNEKTSDVTLPPPGWNNEVAFLASHSQPSDKLPGRLAVQLCVAPRPSHPCHPFAVRAHGWTSVRPVTESTPCRALHHSTGGGGGTARHGKGSHSNGSVGDVDRGKPQCFHPALGQKGLFAQRDIPPRTLVVPYMGRAHLTQSDDEDPDSRYDAAIVVDGTRCGIDATHMGSEARFVNDYRGILERPNLFFEEWKASFPRDLVVPITESRSESRPDDASQGTTFPSCSSIRPATPPTHVFGLALYSGAHPIKAHTELCVSYGKGWWLARQFDGDSEREHAGSTV